jgi:threonine aldolase
MRQSGILAAAGIYALEHHIDRLAEDHANATLLAHLISERVPNVKVENLEPSTNMVFFVWLGDNGRAEQFNEHCLANGLRLCYLGAGRFRTVTHLDVNRGDIEEAVTIIQEACRLAQ